MNSNKYFINSILNLNQIIQPIIGETCHQVRFSYGDELILDFGEMKPYNHPKLKHLKKGEWQLGTRATPWYLMQNYHFVFYPLPVHTKDHAKIHLQHLENKKLTDFVISGENNFYLTLYFEDDYKLILEPDLDEDDSGLADWELLMPNEQILIVGLGKFWECKSIHEPC